MDKFPFEHNALTAISEGRHSDPFSILGLHAIAGEYWLCAFDPGAEALIVLPASGDEIPAQSTGVAGVLSLNCPMKSPIVCAGKVMAANGKWTILTALPPFWANWTNIYWPRAITRAFGMFWARIQ